MATCNTIRSISCPSPSTIADCSLWEFNGSHDFCFIENQAREALAIAGAPLNIHRLLGVLEQKSLTDQTGQGQPISSGDHPLHPASNAYTQYDTMWKSRLTGQDLIDRGYLGYDFGVQKIIGGRARYTVPAPNIHNVSMIKIKQGADPANRVTKARVERSEDGVSWNGVAVIYLPNNDQLNTITFRQTAPARFWRVRPLEFGGIDCDSWVVQALELIEQTSTDERNIEDIVLFENRNRDYTTTPISMKGYYDLLSPQTILMRLGAGITTTTYNIRVLFSSCISQLGRPIVIGDIIELPSETQYTPALDPIKRYVEVTDVTWDSTTYTPGWVPIMLLVTAQPALASQETRKIFGDISMKVDGMGLFQPMDEGAIKYQDFSEITDGIRAEAIAELPEMGSEGSNTVREFTPEEVALAAPFGNLKPLNFNRTGLYVEDALPQNGAPYTEGPEFPASPKDGDYHRMVYVGMSRDIPAKLYRFSTTKNRWIYLETDRREEHNAVKPVLKEYLASPNAVPARTIK